MSAADTWAAELEAKCAAVFVAQVRAIDAGLADIVQGHLDRGMSLKAVQALLADAVQLARVIGGKQS